MDVTAENYLKIKKRIKAGLVRYNLGHLAEDFTHDYFIHVMSGHGKHQTINQFIVDNLRRITGRRKDKEQKIAELYNKHVRLK